RHAYPGHAGDIELRWEAGSGPVVLEIEDEGVPFDLRSAPAPDLRSGIEERPIGGLGIHFIRSLVEAADSRREGDRNILRLVLGPDPPAAVRDAGDDELRFPLSSMNRETYRKGDILFKAGDRADKMYYVARGSLRLPEIGKVVAEGEVIGEMGILSPFHARTASAVCAEDLEAYTIDKDDVIRLFNEDPALAFRLVHLCIKRFIENLRAETEAKERIQSELRIARDIQTSMLPRVFPPFPGRTEFDIYAVMEPAKEVGGDFYDFFLIDEWRLCVLIGDVSGKGVPAALFMAICKTLLKTEALRGLPPAEILARVNRILIPDNETMMFVTVFLLVLDIESGEVLFANGGHPAPLVSAGGSGFDLLPGPTGMILGAVEADAFQTGSIRLKPGDAVFLYTDGVTEAMDADQRLYSEARLVEGLAGPADGSAQALVHRVRASILDFVRGNPPSDDITMVVLRYRGRA
ncbi:MAG: SpoIIE family protein phosphatase, partial [Acidobacteriota bacterium]|nr:SpoIIE family protein phosphatase [Acidobacteriota bacterium]